jgi:serine/threonine protein kinase
VLPVEGEAAASTSGLPENFDGFRLVRVLGRGAAGEVYLGHDTLLDRAVAIKLITTAELDEAARARVLTEARAVARLRHPNVVGIYRLGEVGGRPYLVTELVRGTSLDKLRVPLSADALVALALGVARGLAAAHRQGVLHRDLKPANVVLGEAAGEIKIVDFGLASSRSSP